MGNFYNPFMKPPDWGAGIAGTSNNILQMLLMKKLMGGGDAKTELGQTPLQQPQSPMQKSAEMANQDALMGGAGKAAGQWDDRGDIMSDPNIKDILSRFMALMKGGGMGGMSGGM